MSTETEVDQQESEHAFNSGFNSVRQSDDFESPDDQREEAAGDEDDSQTEATEEAEEAAEEEAVFAGLTEKQLKALLERATRVDSIEDQLRKAHGKIGELHGTLKELQQSRHQPTPSAPAVGLDDAQLSDFEEMFPEFAPAVEARARRIAQEVFQQMLDNGQQADPEQISRTANIAVMDSVHKGWRDDVTSDEFKLWIATQPEPVQQTYHSTWSAAELGAIVSEFRSRQASAGTQRQKTRQRLESALTPDARASKVRHGLSDEDAFNAGFESVRNPKYY